MKSLLSWLLATILLCGVGCDEEKWKKFEQEGYEAAKEGAPPEVCPYKHLNTTSPNERDPRKNWMIGYRKGLLEMKAKKPEVESKP